MPSTNGHNPNGEWSSLTLPDSGATLEYRHVSHMLLNDVQRSMKKPKPPMQEIDYGGNKRMEPNRNHPDYLEALQDFNSERAECVLNMAILLGVRVDVDVARVIELRDMLTESGVPLPANDKVLYVTRILCETGNDLTALRDAIIRKSQPTEEAVSDSVERFPADVSQGRPVPPEGSA